MLSWYFHNFGKNPSGSPCRPRHIKQNSRARHDPKYSALICLGACRGYCSKFAFFFSRTEDPYSYFTCSSMNLFYQSFRYLLCCYKICLAGCFHMINSGKNPSGSQYRTGHIKYNHAPDSGFSFFLGACGYYSKFGSFTEDRRPRFHTPVLPVVA